MTLQVPWVIFGAAIILGIVKTIANYVKGKRKFTAKEVINDFADATQLVAGIYSLMYVLTFVGKNALGLGLQIPQDDGALALALFIGGIYLVFPRIFKYFKSIFSSKKVR